MGRNVSTCMSLSLFCCQHNFVVVMMMMVIVNIIGGGSGSDLLANACKKKLEQNVHKNRIWRFADFSARNNIVRTCGRGTLSYRNQTKDEPKKCFRWELCVLLTLTDIPNSDRLVCVPCECVWRRNQPLGAYYV